MIKSYLYIIRFYVYILKLSRMIATHLSLKLDWMQLIRVAPSMKIQARLEILIKPKWTHMR